MAWPTTLFVRATCALAVPHVLFAAALLSQEPPAPPAPRRVDMDDSGNCLTCRVEVTRIATLGADSGRGAIAGVPSHVVTDTQGRIFVTFSSGEMPLVLDSAGGFVAQIGGRGAGPGQFTAPLFVRVGAADTVYVFERRAVSVFTKELRFVRKVTLPMPIADALPGPSGGFIVSDPLGASVTTLVVGGSAASRGSGTAGASGASGVSGAARGAGAVGAARGPGGAAAAGTPPASALHVLRADGTLDHSYARLPGQETATFGLSPAPDGGVWAFDHPRYEFLLVDPDGRPSLQLTRHAFFFPGTPGTPLSAVAAASQSADGVLWVAGRIKAANWEQYAPGAAGGAGGVSGAGGVGGAEPSVAPVAWDKLYDSFVEALDLRSARLVGTQLVKGYPVGFIGTDLLVTYGSDDKNIRRLMVWRVRPLY